MSVAEVGTPRRSDVVISVEEHEGVAVVRLDDGKVNALDLELLTAISATMSRLVMRRRWF
jgi:enoyl-CoA hydratase/carnithine racemase